MSALTDIEMIVHQEREIAALRAENARLRKLIDRLANWSVKYPAGRIFPQHMANRCDEELKAIEADALAATKGEK